MENIIGVIFGSLGPVIRSKARLLGQQSVQVSSASTPIFRSSSSKGAIFFTNVSKGGRNVSKNIKESLVLLNLSRSKNSDMKEDDGTSSGRSSPLTLHNVSQSRINQCENLCYYTSSTTIMQAIMTSASSMEEQLANLTKAIVGLTKCMQNQNARIYKLTYRVEVLIEREYNHAPAKHPKVQEIDPPTRQVTSTKEIPVSSEEMIPINRLNEFIEETIKENYEVVITTQNPALGVVMEPSLYD